jgi:Fe-S-cluster containining protein
MRNPVEVEAEKVFSSLDCRTCGACCAPQINDAFYVGISATDIARLTHRWRERHTAHGAILTKLDPVGRCVCVALRGAIGHRVSCAIYARRPDECRTLTAGSKECLAARRQAGL